MSSYQVIIGSVGVGLLLLGFVLNLFKKFSQESLVYIALNIVGAGLSCYASVLIDYLPFVILEGAWTLVALVALVKRIGDTK
jgi:hypothetical protein